MKVWGRVGGPGTPGSVSKHAAQTVPENTSLPTIDAGSLISIRNKLKKVCPGKRVPDGASGKRTADEFIHIKFMMRSIHCAKPARLYLLKTEMWF